MQVYASDKAQVWVASEIQSWRNYSHPVVCFHFWKDERKLGDMKYKICGGNVIYMWCSFHWDCSFIWIIHVSMNLQHFQQKLKKEKSPLEMLLPRSIFPFTLHAEYFHLPYERLLKMARPRPQLARLELEKVMGQPWHWLGGSVSLCVWCSAANPGLHPLWRVWRHVWWWMKTYSR